MKQLWNPNRVAEFVAVATALNSDTTKHDTTIEAAAGILMPGQLAGVGSNTASSVMLADLINRGKAGGLSVSQMVAAIDGVVGQAAPPGNRRCPLCQRGRHARQLHHRQLGRHAKLLRLCLEAQRNDGDWSPMLRPTPWWGAILGSRLHVW